MSDQSSAAVQPVGAVGDGQSQQDPVKTVSYETHERLLREKKKLQEEAELLRNEKKLREDEEAKKRGDFEALLKSREEELSIAKSKLTSLQDRIMDAQKLTAVLNTAGSPIDSKWHGLIDTNKIVVHPDTGEVDQMSVTRVVEDLRKSWPEMFKVKGQTLPADAPLGNGAGKISRSEWLKLPLKDMTKWKPDQIME